MSTARIIRADVIDITHDSPTDRDLLLVDTNVWIWLTYPPATLLQKSQSQQANDYPRYVNAAVSANATLAHTGLAFTEVASVIERLEHQAYAKTHTNVSKKDFRHMPLERRRVARLIIASWRQMGQFSAPLDVPMAQSDIRSAIARVLTWSIDGNDALFLLAATREGIRDIVSDDSDFAAIPGIRLFTANPAVIATASAQGRLIRR